MISKEEMLREQIMIAIDGHDGQDAINALAYCLGRIAISKGQSPLQAMADAMVASIPYKLRTVASFERS